MLNYRRSLSICSAISGYSGISEPGAKYAVDVQNVVFGYKKNIKVLNKMTVRIAEGKIFALLGSNNSGKTTLLRLILGRHKPRSGTIRVFGSYCGTSQLEIPGPGVGYMPEEIGLFTEFTIKEILLYYSLIYKMDSNETDLRIKELAKLLDLVLNHQLIEELAHDQQRMVSLAICLLHSPKLLLLDEPTVAVDSIVRCRIWDVLAKICKESGTTVLITSHCIDEARNAHTVGFSYSGKCLRSAPPEHFLRRYRCLSLEGVYFELCRDFIAKSKESFKYVMEDEENKFIKIQDILSEIEDEEKSTLIQSFNIQHIRALIYKNGISAKRRPYLICLYFLVPIIFIYLMSVCFGRPHHIPIGVFNADRIPQYSKAFLDRMDEHMFEKNILKTNDSIIGSVVNGQNYLSLVFSDNFTENFKKRLLTPNITKESLESSRIKVYVDMSDPIIAYFSQIYLIQSFHKFLSMFSSLITRNSLAFSQPIKLQELIYGQIDGSYDHFLCPGLVLAIIQFLNILIATYYAFNFKSQSKTTFTDRGLAAGLTKFEMLFAQTVLVGPLVICQALVVASLLFFVFEYPLNGNFFDVFLLFVLQGIQGITLGTTIALVFTEFLSSAFAIGFLIIPLWLTSGMFWPLECTPPYLQKIIEYLPSVKPLLSLRCIMFKGWTLFNSIQVLSGYFVLFTYIMIFSIINQLLMKNV